MASSYYEHQLERGQAYQDFIAERLYHYGIPLVNFQTRERQIAVGENLLGLEIKLDDILATSNNLWIEVAEKRDSSQALWVRSGIDRDDNAWLYGIGDYSEFFLFSKRALREESRRGRVIEENHRGTSRGFRLCRRDAMGLVERHFSFDQGATVSPITQSDIPWGSGR